MVRGFEGALCRHVNASGVEGSDGGEPGQRGPSEMVVPIGERTDRKHAGVPGLAPRGTGRLEQNVSGAAQGSARSSGFLLVAARVATLGLHPRDVEIGLDQLLVERCQAEKTPGQ